MYPTTKPTEQEQQVANQIMDYVNAHGRSPEGLVAALSRDHRTLQQHFTRIAIAWFQYLAKLEHGEYDPRNEGSVRLAKEIAPHLEKAYLPYI